MRAEDLFEAMGGLDEELITRSEKSAQSVRKDEKADKAKKKRRRRASAYRYFMIAASTAAIVFLFLMARDFISPRGTHKMSSYAITEGADSLQEDSEEQMVAEAAEEAPESEVAEAASADQNTDSVTADQNTDSSALKKKEESTLESIPDEEVYSEEAEAAEASGSDAAETSGGDAAEEGKEAVDLLGDLKGDYVKLEYISVADEANGGERIIPEYTAEGEEALSTALDTGKAKPSILANTGQAVYYVYLTKANGEEHKITFYEYNYVSMDTIPGMVMKISNAEYEAVMELFR